MDKLKKLEEERNNLKDKLARIDEQITHIMDKEQVIEFKRLSEMVKKYEDKFGRYFIEDLRVKTSDT